VGSAGRRRHGFAGATVTEVREQCEQAGIGWAIWEDPVNLKLFDSAAGTWVSQIVDALLP
jgi:hypothetical protein